MDRVLPLDPYTLAPVDEPWRNREAGVKGSAVRHEAFTQTMEEIVYVVEQAGLTPDPEDLTQLWQALQRTRGGSKEIFGAVRLVYDAGVLRLRPWYGASLRIGGVYHDLPAAGVTLASPGTVDTTFYIYAGWSGSAVTLTASAAAPVQDTADLQMRHPTIPALAYVGLARTSGAGAWQNAPLVASHYNALPRVAAAVQGTGQVTASTVYIEIPSTRVAFVSDDGFMLALAQTSAAADNGPIPNLTEAGHFAIGLDAIAPAGQAPRIHSQYLSGVSGFALSSTLARGTHFVTTIYQSVAGINTRVDNVQIALLTYG